MEINLNDYCDALIFENLVLAMELVKSSSNLVETLPLLFVCVNSLNSVQTCNKILEISNHCIHNKFCTPKSLIPSPTNYIPNSLVRTNVLANEIKPNKGT